MVPGLMQVVKFRESENGTKVGNHPTNIVIYNRAKVKWKRLLDTVERVISG